MFPIFIPPESDQNPRMRTRAKLGVVIGLAVAMLMGLLLFRGSAAAPFPWVVFTLVIVMGIAGLMAVFAVQRGALESQKRKRQGVDMYTLIDRLVDDLDDDEAAHLRRRLDDRERGLEETLQETRDRREDDRLAGRR
ncbi:MAG: hypothetical protein HXY41_17735 [Chloroflexi bacterium]|nr:hypothetical protein [Chloroflexota bacterium]